MIYLDNAATSFPKPQIVRNSVINSFTYSANPGRAGHKLSIKAAETLFECRNNIGSLMNFSNPEKVILTPGCTFAINTVIKGILKKGDHVVISSLEHNSVVRPLQKLSDSGVIKYDIAKAYEADDDKTVDSFRKAFRDNTKLVICTHASNVFGLKLPVSRIAALCRFYGVLFCVDAAQSAGVFDIDLEDIGADFICAPGHKGLYGPMGTGFLIINSEIIPSSLTEGGTGSGSSELIQPQMLPDKFESGTINLHGFAGLKDGISFVRRKTPENILKHEMNLIAYLYDNLKDIKGVKLYTKRPDTEHYAPILSFNVDDFDSEQVAQFLNDKYSIAVRAGLHCSPLAHREFSTDHTGTVRVSPSIYTQYKDINTLINAVFMLTKSKKFAI